MNKIRNELDNRRKQENMEIEELQSTLDSQQRSLNEQVKKLIYLTEN